MRYTLVKTAKILTITGVLFVSGLVLLAAPECVKSRVWIFNDSSSPLADVTLTMQESTVWSGRLDTSEVRRIAIARNVDGPFLLKGRYVNTGRRFEGTSSHARAFSILFDEVIHLFLIKNSEVHAGSLYDPPRIPSEKRTILSGMRGLGFVFLHVMSCADHELLSWIRGSSEY